MSAASLPKVCVADEDFDRARALLIDAEAARSGRVA